MTDQSTLDADSLSAEQKQLAKTIGNAAVEAGIDPDLAIAQAYAETGLRHYLSASDIKNKNVNYIQDKEGNYVISGPQTKYGKAVGLMQILPSTAELYGYTPEDLIDPAKNVKVYVDIMNKHLQKYGEPDLALMAYHQGEEPVDNYLKDNDIKHFGPNGREYLKKIFSIYSPASQAPSEEPQEALTVGEKLAAQRDKEFSEEKDYQELSAGDTAAEFGVYGAAAGIPASKVQRQLNKAVPKVSPTAQAPKMPMGGVEPPLTAGDKWASKVTGSMGPSGETVTEAARNYQMQQELEKSGVGSKFRPNREGIILDTRTQQALEAQRKAAEELELQRVAKEEARLARLRSPLAKVASLGMKAPILNTLGGLGAGLNVGLAKERFESGDPLGAAVASLNALSSGLAMIPVSPLTANPYALGAKGVGMLGGLAGIPLEYAYGKYREANPLPARPRKPVPPARLNVRP